MSRLTVFVCMLMLVAAVISVDVPSSPKPGEHGQPDLMHPGDMHKQHDPMHHLEPPKMPDSKDMKTFQDMHGQAKS